MIYADIEDFCLKRSVIKKKLFSLTNLADIRKVMNTVDSNKVFRFTYKKKIEQNELCNAILLPLCEGAS